MNAIRNFEQGGRADQMEAGLRGVVAGLAKIIHTENYYAKRARIGGGNWESSESYVVPGTALCRLAADNVTLVLTTDLACQDLIACARHCFGGWLGVDGKHKTNYSGFALVPLVSKDCDDRYFVVALVLVSSEHGARIAAAIRLVLAWCIKRFPGATDGLERICHLPATGNGEDIGADDDSGDEYDDDDEYDDGDEDGVALFDPATQEPTDARRKTRRQRGALRALWEVKINGFLDWGAMDCGYPEAAVEPLQRHEEGPPEALRMRYGGADNADNYASALAYGAHARVANCAVHLIVNNLCKRGTTLYRLLGGPNEDGPRAGVHTLVKLLRDAPCLLSNGPVPSTVERRDDGIFTVGWNLLLKELCATGFGAAAEALEAEYLSSPRKRRWGGCYFPRFIPNHNAGTESMNAKLAKELQKFRLCETTVFVHRCMHHLQSKSVLRSLPGNGFSVSIKRVMKDNRTWRKVHKLIHGPELPRSQFVADMVARLQMHTARTRFMRATSVRWCIPSAQMLEHLLQAHNGSEQQVMTSLTTCRDTHCRLVSDPVRYEAELEPSVNQFLRIAVRAFYVLSALEPGEVRSPFCMFSCTCGFHRIRSYCKHAIALTILLKHVEVPTEMDFRVLQRLPSKGRKRMRVQMELMREFSQDANISITDKEGEGRDSGSDTEPDSGDEVSDGSESDGQGSRTDEDDE